MFPLKQKVVSGTRFGEPSARDGKPHKGCDYRARLDTLYMPFSGEIIREGYQETGAGNFVVIRPDFDKTIEIKCFHLTEKKPKGRYQEGDKIGVTGNTGFSLGFHLHLELWIKGKPTDPEKFNWNMITQKLLLYTYNPALVPFIKDWFSEQGITIQIESYPVPTDLIIGTYGFPNSHGTGVVGIINDSQYKKPGYDMTFIFHDPTHETPQSTNPFTTAEKISQYAFPPNGNQNVWKEFVIHELCHSECFIANENGANIRDYDIKNSDGSINFGLVHSHGGLTGPGSYVEVIKQLKPYLTSSQGPTPIIMTKEEVQKIYALAFYRSPDAGELAFWTGKTLIEFLTTAIKDRAAFLGQNQ